MFLAVYLVVTLQQEFEGKDLIAVGALVDAEVGGDVGGLVVALDGAEGVEDLRGGAAGLGADGALAARWVGGGGGGAARFEPGERRFVQ